MQFLWLDALTIPVINPINIFLINSHIFLNHIPENFLMSRIDFKPFHVFFDAVPVSFKLITVSK